MVSMHRRNSTSSRGGNQRVLAASAIFLALTLAAFASVSLRNFDKDSDGSGFLSLNTTPVTDSDATLLFHSRLTSRGVPPVVCSKVLRTARTNATNDPNEGKLFARYTVEEPHFFISVHNKDYDKIRYDMFERYGFYYERALSDCFRQILRNDDDDDKPNEKRVLDVGGNIGWYALLSAALGAQVATFEPHLPNYLRMCESMCLNHWLRSSSEIDNEACMMGSDDSTLIPKHIHIFPYAVSDENKDLHFVIKRNNPGQGEIMQNVSKASTPIRCVTLDDMVEAIGWTTGDIDILKVDVEGAEMGVFLGAKQLLKSNRVQNIFMEGNVRSESETAEFRTLIQLFMDSDYYIYKIGGWSGPTSTTNVPNMDKNFTQNLIAECGINPNALQCNLWWKTKQSLKQGM